MSHCEMSLNQPRNKGVRRRVLSWAIPLCVLHTVALAGLHRMPEHGVARVAVALFAGCMLTGLVASIVPLALALRDDEFERALLVQSALWSIAVTLAFTTVWGYAQAFAGGPVLNPAYIFLLFGYVTGLMNLFLRRRERSTRQDDLRA